MTEYSNHFDQNTYEDNVEFMNNSISRSDEDCNKFREDLAVRPTLPIVPETIEFFARKIGIAVPSDAIISLSKYYLSDDFNKFKSEITHDR